MKKISLILMISCGYFLLFSLGGCSNQQEPTNPAALTADVYFPILNNTKYIYQGEGNEYASYDVYNDYTSEDQVQQRISNGGTVMAKVITVNNGALTQTFSRGEVYHRENYLDKTGDNEVLLAEPIAPGTTWTLEDGRIRTITSISVPVSTPAGDYDAIEVTTEADNDTTIQYYVKDVGLIKTVYQAGEAEISSTLSSIEKDMPFPQTIRFYYPNVDENLVYYEDRVIDFHTNDVSKDIIAQAYKEVPNGGETVFSANTAINSLSLGDDGIVYLDLNQAFLSEMNAGAGYEEMLLKCIANTFGYYCNTDKVALTIEGKPYSSGHLTFRAGEYLQTQVEDAVKL